MEFYEGYEACISQICDKSNDKFKKQATYPEGNHIVFKQEYWENPTRKRPKD